MSKAKNATFTSTNSSSHTRRSHHRLFARAIFFTTQLLGQLLDLHSMFKQWIIAVPLREISAAHEGAVLRCASVVVPQVEVLEIERRLKRLLPKQAVAP